MENTAIHIVKTFQEQGFEAYFAGGSVRDLLMEKDPQDYDIATSANPDQIEQVLNSIIHDDSEYSDIKVLPIGKQFGVMMGVIHGHSFEVATFRSDSSSGDGRRPDAVQFTSAKEDAVRRDFTINGLFYDPLKKEVFDYVEGQKDIQKKLIRFIGEPHERIKEDHLRILRAIRFRNQFEFEYDPLTQKAIQDLAHLVQDISAERIEQELTKMLLSKHRARALKELNDFGILKYILPELITCQGVRQPGQYHQEGDVYSHLLKAIHDMPEEWVNKEMVWATLLHDIGKPQTFEEKEDRIHFDGHAEKSAQIASDILRRLRFSNAEISKITWMIDQHMSVGLIPEMRRAHQVHLFWNPWFEDLMKLHYCDENGSHPPDLSLYEEIMKLYQEFKNQKLLEDHFKPFLNGRDLIQGFDLQPGPMIQFILDELKAQQIEGLINSRQEAEKFVKSYLDSENSKVVND